MVVGANHDNNLTGTVFVYADLKPVAVVQPFNTSAAYFGSSVALGSFLSQGKQTWILAASAPFFENGIVYLYNVRYSSSSTTVEFWTTLLPSSLSTGACFGIALSFSFHSLAVGAWQNGKDGSVFVYERGMDSRY